MQVKANFFEYIPYNQQTELDFKRYDFFVDNKVEESYIEPKTLEVKNSSQLEIKLKE